MTCDLYFDKQFIQTKVTRFAFFRSTASEKSNGTRFDNLKHFHHSEIDIGVFLNNVIILAIIKCYAIH